MHTSPSFTVMTCGVNPTPPVPPVQIKTKKDSFKTQAYISKNYQQICTQLPKASSCFFPEPGGLPLCFLEGCSDATSTPLPAPPPESARPADMVVGDKPKAMLPSGVYFLGLPRFFLAGSILNPIPEEEVGDDPSRAPSGLDCSRWADIALKGKPPPTAAF